MNRLLERVVGAAYEVANVLGGGFLEKVYERALAVECVSRGLKVVSQAPLHVSYKGQVIGDYYADLLIDDKLVIELKCVDKLKDEHMAQCLNYLRAGNYRLAALFNFQRPRVEWRRIVHDF